MNRFRKIGGTASDGSEKAVKNPFSLNLRQILGCGGLLVLATLVSFAILRDHVYILKQVNPEQVGVRIRGGQIYEIVPPGVYSDIGLFVKLETYSTASYQFTVNDPEVLTSDQQRLGVTVSGSVFRPSWTDVQSVKALWAQYRTIFLNDEALQKVMNDLSMQAMKVCVGDRPFADSVIGSDRDSLRGCVDAELDKLTTPYGLTVANVTVPNVALSSEVQAKLDAITQSRLDTEKARQDELKAIAEGKAQQAQQEAAIRVEQSRKQEEARQQTSLARLEEEKLRAQNAVISAQKANELLSAQKDLEIAKAKAAAAAEQAKADLAKEIALAGIYSTNPNYYTYQMTLANASAIQPTDKLIFTQEGVFPQLVFGNGFMPTVPLDPTQPDPVDIQPTPAPESP